MSAKKEALVSVIMPAYNCGDYIGTSLDSVINQTYKNWEVIVVDDSSTDNTETVVKKYKRDDKRIRYHKLKNNSGAAAARNKAIDLAKGEYMAFLDSDDIWAPEKLYKQVNFMENNGYNFTCTSYTKIDEDGQYMNKTISTQPKRGYDELLKSCPGNSTVVYNARKLGKFKIENIKKRNDYLMWLKVIKKEKILVGIDEPLGSHRIREDSISRNKTSLVKYHWKIYREFEQLSVIKSTTLIFYWIVVTLFKLR